MFRKREDGERSGREKSDKLLILEIAYTLLRVCLTLAWGISRKNDFLLNLL